MVVERGVDLLGDGLVRVEREEPIHDPSLGEATAQHAAPDPPPTGPCELCRESPAAARCVHCRRAACRDHFWIMLGLCHGCATEEEMRQAREGGLRKRPRLDIKWIEE